MYLKIERGTVNGGQWGPVNDEQAAIVSDNLAKLALVIAKTMCPDAEVEVVDVAKTFTYGTLCAKRKPEPDSEFEVMGQRMLAVNREIGTHLGSPALWRADFDVDAYLGSLPEPEER